VTPHVGEAEAERLLVELVERHGTTPWHVQRAAVRPRDTPSGARGVLPRPATRVGAVYGTRPGTRTPGVPSSSGIGSDCLSAEPLE
jgi:hypothetical protein